MTRPDDEEGSVRHLVELGYVDPEDAAAVRRDRRTRLEVQLRLSLERIAQGRGGEAIEVLERLAANDPDWVRPRQLLAEVHFTRGDHAAARPHIDWLTLHNVITPRLALVAGTLALARGEVKAAFVELDYARHADPNLAGVAALLGTVHLRLGEWDAAEECFRQALRENSADARALDGLAAVALRRKQFESAADHALRALEHDIRLRLAHYHLGIALARLDRRDAAAEAFAACARLDPSRAAPLIRLSRVVNDPARAAEYRRQARQLIDQRRRSQPPPSSSA